MSTNTKEIVLQRLELESVVHFLTQYEIFKITRGKKQIHELLTSTVLAQLSEAGWELPQRVEKIPHESKHDRKKRLHVAQDASTRAAIFEAVKPEDDFEAATAFSRECKTREPEDVAEYVRMFKLLRGIIPSETYADEDVRNKFLLGFKDPTFRGQMRSMFDSSSDLDSLHSGAIAHAEKVAKAVKLASRYMIKQPKPQASGSSEPKRLQPAMRPRNDRTERSFSTNQPVVCHNCGRKGHKSNVCNSPKAKCAKCGREGHLQDYCRSSVNGPRYLFSFNAKPTATWTSKILIGNSPDIIVAQLDTGATHNFISKELCTKHDIAIEDESHSVTVGDGRAVAALGSCKVTFALVETPTCSSLRVETSALVLESPPFDVIIGFPMLSECGIVQDLSKEPHGGTSELDEDDLSFPVLATMSAERKGLKAQMLERFPDLFGPLSPVAAKLAPYDLKIDESHVVSAPPYFAAGPQRKAIEDQTDEWLSLGVVEPSTSPWGSGVVLVDKKTGAYRMCVDFRQINSRTLPFDFPLPRIDDLIDLLASNAYFATLDMTNGYLQVPLTERCKHLTTYVTHQGRFQFNRLPFGLKCAGAHFQYCLEVLLAEHLTNCCAVYQDDILVFAPSREQLVIKLTAVLETLDGANIRLNIDKCEFELEELDYLGWTVSKEGKSISKSRIKDLVAINSPKNASQAREVMGFLNYFRNFVGDFARRTNGINELTKKGITFNWAPELEEQLRRLIVDLTSAPILVHYDPDAQHTLVTDASDAGLGGVLLQNGRPLVYLSKTFSTVQGRWPTVEKEAYAILYCVKKVERYVRHKKFLVRTDHRNLIYVWKAASPKVTRWRLLLSEFDYDIEHIPGTENAAADCLSRLFSLSLTHEDLITKYHILAGIHLTVNKTVQYLRSHDHLWANMRQEVKKWVQTCPVCQKMDPSPPERVTLSLPPSGSPLYEVHIDTMGPYPAHDGMKYILVIIDRFSRLTELVPIPDTKAHTAAKAFINRWCLRYGSPAKIQTDGGSQFRNSFFETLEKVWTHHITTPYRHEANSIVERMNREINKWLKRRRISIRELDDWPSHLPAVQYVINSSKSSVSGFSPMQLVYGRTLTLEQPAVLLDVASEEFHSAAACRIRDLVKYNVALSLSEQDKAEKAKRARLPAPVSRRTPKWVLVKYPERPPSKLLSTYRGPMKVHAVTQREGHTVAYTVSDAWNPSAQRLKVDAARVSLFNQGDLTDAQVEELSATDVHEYGVDRILQSRDSPTGPEYLVEWTGYEPEEATWEPEDALKHLSAFTAFRQAAGQGAC